MAGRFGSSSSSSSSLTTMTVVNTPSVDLAFTNFVYCSPSDLRTFTSTASGLVSVAESVILTVRAHGSISPGNIALNAVQRRNLKVSTGDSVTLSRFIAPSDFNLALLTLEVGFVKTIKGKNEQGKNLLVIGTTSAVEVLDSLGFHDAFAVKYHVPRLRTEDAKKVLKALNVFADDHIDAAAEALNNVPIKKLYMLVEMAAQGERGGSSEAIYSGKEKININHFFDCLGDIGTGSQFYG